MIIGKYRPLPSSGPAVSRGAWSLNLFRGNAVTYISVVAEMSVQQVLDRKDGRIVAIPADSAMSAVIELLSKQFIGTVMLTAPDGALAGILSERDIIKAVCKHGEKAFAMRAEELMVRKVVSCSPEMSIEGVLSLMSAHTIRHVPVLQNGKILGLISVRCPSSE
jgi:CBS domain-containing protein